MLEIEKEIFKKSIADFNRLKQYGFILIDNHYVFNKTFFHNEFKATIIVDKNSIVTSKVVDLDTGEEYSNIKNSAFTDGFVLKVREAYEILLNDIKTKCFVSRYFCSKQGMMILDYIDETYHIYPEFLWPKHPSYGVFRHQDNKRWFAIIMLINKNKIADTSGEIEIINLKLEKQKIKELLKNKKGYYSAYHMNKQNWITLSLDDSIADDILLGLIDESFRITSFN